MVRLTFFAMNFSETKAKIDELNVVLADATAEYINAPTAATKDAARRKSSQKM